MRLQRPFFTLEYSHYSANRKATSLTKDVNALLLITKKKKKKQAPVVPRSDNAIQWIDLYIHLQELQNGSLPKLCFDTSCRSRHIAPRGRGGKTKDGAKITD